MRGAGSALRVDVSEHHIHHELDGSTLLNGSDNWARSAASHNEANLIVTSEPALVRAFATQFASIWHALGH